MRSLRVGQDWATSLSLSTFMRWRSKWQPTPVFLLGESQGRGSLVGCHLWGHTESDKTEVISSSSIFLQHPFIRTKSDCFQSNLYSIYDHVYGFPDVWDGKEFACNAGDLGLIPRLGGYLGEGREWLSTPVFLPGEFHEQRILVGSTVHGVAESDTTE